MANETILKNNLTPVVTNNDSVSKEETIMGTTTMNNEVVVIEFAVAEQLKNRLEIKGIHSDGYLGKTEIGEILGFSKRKVNASKREELLEALKLAVEEACKSEKKSKKASTKKEETKVEEKKEAKKESETKDKTPQEKLNAFLEDLRYASLKNKDKGYGTSVTAFMLNALILKQYDIDNFKEALKNDAITRKTGKGDIIVTEEKINKIKEIKKWLISKGIIKAAIYTSDTHKNYYMEDVYDGIYAKSMTKLTKEIYSLLHDVKPVSYRVF
jgi:hypothetical protein